MDTNRIIIYNHDLSTATVEAQTSRCGFTVVDAEKGPRHPVRIPAGGNAKLQDIFGKASKEHPQLFEVESFITDYDLYVSAPYGEGTKIPVAYITEDGIFAAKDPVKYDDTIEKIVFDDYVSSDEEQAAFFDFQNINVQEDGDSDESASGDSDEAAAAASVVVKVDARYSKTNLGFGKNLDSEKVAVEFVQEGADDANLSSDFAWLKVYVGIVSGSSDEKALKALVPGIIPGVLIEGPESPMFISASIKNIQAQNNSGESVNTGETAIEFKYGDSDCILDANAYLCIPIVHEEAPWFENPENLEKVEAYWEKNVKVVDIKGAIFPKYPSERALYLSFANYAGLNGKSSKNAAGRNYLKFNVYEEGSFHNAARAIMVEGSLDDTARTAAGGYLAFNKNNASYSSQDLVAVISFGGFEAGKSYKEIPGYGSVVLKGGVRVKDTDLEAGWEEAGSEEYSDVDIFFDSERHCGEINGESKFFSLYKAHPLSGYIFNYTPSSAATESLKNLEPLTFGSNYWSICNEAILTLDGSSKIISPMTGARAKMQVRIIENRWGGIAPMYLNTGTPSMGGQLDLGKADIKVRFRYTKDQQEALEKLNMNPIIFDNTYKLMVVGQKTCRGGELTDWSYIGHVSSFLEFEREVRETVMIPQLGKANNDYYRTLRKQQVESILSKRLAGTTRIWAAGNVDTSTADGVNDLAARRARKFVINVKVKVDVFSEAVELNFTNVDQGMEV